MHWHAIHTHTHTYIYICIHVLYVHAYTYISTLIHARINIWFAYIYKYIHIYLHIHFVGYLGLGGYADVLLRWGVRTSQTCCVKSLCQKKPVRLLKHHEQPVRKSDRKGCERMCEQQEAWNACARLFVNDATGREEPTYNSDRV